MDRTNDLPISQLKSLSTEIEFLSKFIACIKSNKVVVEDDTCNERIITALETFCKKLEYADCIATVLDRDEVVSYSTLDYVISHANDYQPSIVALALKLFAALSHVNIVEQLSKLKLEQWRHCLETVISTGLGNFVLDHSYQYACLQALFKIFSNHHSLLTVLKYIHAMKDILLLAQSSSMFVANYACLTFSMLVITLQKTVQATKEKCLLMKCEDANREIFDLLIRSTLQIQLKIFCECSKLNFEYASFFIESNFQNYFFNETTQFALLDLCDTAHFALCSFISSITAKPRWIASDLLHKMVICCLFATPLHSSAYTMLVHVATLTQENISFYFGLLTFPFEHCIGDEIESSKCFKMLAWKTILKDLFENVIKISKLLCHCSVCLSQLCCNHLVDSDSRSIVLHLFTHLLSLVHELDGPSKSARLRSGKAVLAMLDCLLAITVTCSGCLDCMGIGTKLISTMTSMLTHADSNQQSMDKCARIITASIRTSCVLHQHSDILIKLIDILLLKLEHPRWLDRDTALELFGHLFKLAPTLSKELQSVMKDRLIGTDLIGSIISLACDRNSYVRSTALLTLSHIPTMDDVSTMDRLSDVASRVLDEDEDPGARRASVKLLNNLLEVNPLICEQVCWRLAQCVEGQGSDGRLQDVVHSCEDLLRNRILSDADWEVRLHGVASLSTVYRCAPHPVRNQLSPVIRSLLEPLLGCYDQVVYESTMDLVALMDGCYDPSIDEMRKDSSIIEELKSLLRDVLHRADAHSLEVQEHSLEDDVIMDCY